MPLGDAPGCRLERIEVQARTMEETHYTIQVAPDHVQRLCGGTPSRAISELVWNSLDADATRVQVTTLDNELGTATLIVRDNGHGIPYRNIKELFVNLGGSWKAQATKTKQRGRALHGKEGKGRFKALALGRVSEWIITYKEDNEFHRYTVIVLADDILDVRVTADAVVEADEPGVEVRISEVSARIDPADDGALTQEIAEIFAPYLTDYSDVQVTIGARALDPTDFIASRKSFDLADILVTEQEVYKATLDVVEWRATTQRILYLCSRSGMPYSRVDTRFHTPAFHFSAYLRSEYHEKLREGDENLYLAELHAPLAKARDEALERIKEFSFERAAHVARDVVEGWKRDNVYPYKDETSDPVEQMERQVFDIVALSLNKHFPELGQGTRRSKSLQLGLLRKAIENGPQELQPLLLEVLELPPRERRELSALLEESSLTALIRATRLITDRMKFVTGLEHLVFDPELKAMVLERTQLHRLLADNTWVFGEAFNLSADDESLTQVLRKHRELHGDPIVIDRPVKTAEGKTGIVDLMLSRKARTQRADELDHLIVELKRPSITVGSKEIVQTEQYAHAVVDDERFRRVNTRWTFWLVCNDMDSYAKTRASHANAPIGLIYESLDPKVTIWVKTWGQLIADNRARLQFYQESLDYKVSKAQGLGHLKAKYQKILEALDDRDGRSDISG
jgi:hypothetical protein